MLLLAGAPGFVAALGVHWAIGYVDLWHLTPGLAGLALFVITLALLGPYLLGRATSRIIATGRTSAVAAARNEAAPPIDIL